MASTEHASRVLCALTFWRPWTDAIVRGPKRVENRSWAPPAHLLGAYLAIHAGQRYERGDWPWPEGYAPPDAADSPQGIVGVARVVGALRIMPNGMRRRVFRDGDEPLLSRSTLAAVDRLDTLDRDPWWAGPCGWLLDDVTAIEPVAAKGARGLWHVPPDVADEVRRRWRSARTSADATTGAP